jgi:uncharacterized protein (TIGR02246 family)
MFKRYALFVVLFFCVFAAFAQNSVQVEAATQQWATALSSNNPQKIADLYMPGAILYATFQNQLDTPEGIESYFVKLMKHKNLAVKFNKQTIRLFGETAINSGLYTFSYTEKGKQVNIPARYTFVFAHSTKGWEIVEHHSSLLPE